MQLLGFLENVLLSNEEDSWRWSLESDGCFSVKSAFSSLTKELVIGPILSSFELKVFSSIWESPAPSKVVAFSWQLLYDRIPTRDNLLLRGVLPSQSGDLCVWCDDLRESPIHLFLHCKVASLVWYEVFRWLGVVIVLPRNLFYLFEILSEAAKNKKFRKGFRLVWHSVIWSIWKARNNHIFNNVITDPLELVEQAKILAWRWSADRLKITPCLYYEWCWDPGSCFDR
jgi:hypothetical protein